MKSCPYVFLGKSFEHVHRSAKNVFVPSTAIQHDLIIGIAFYKPNAIISIIRLSDGITCEFHAINAVLFFWHLIIKIIIATTKRLRIVFEIAQTIILSIGADALPHCKEYHSAMVRIPTNIRIYKTFSSHLCYHIIPLHSQLFLLLLYTYSPCCYTSPDDTKSTIIKTVILEPDRCNQFKYCSCYC